MLLDLSLPLSAGKLCSKFVATLLCWARRRCEANRAGLSREVRVSNSERGRITFTFCTVSISLCLSNITVYGKSYNASFVVWSLALCIDC